MQIFFFLLLVSIIKLFSQIQKIGFASMCFFVRMARERKVEDRAAFVCFLDRHLVQSALKKRVKFIALEEGCILS